MTRQPKPKCTAATRSGKPCRKAALPSGTCATHGGTNTRPPFAGEQKAAFLALIAAHDDWTLRRAAIALGYPKRDVQAALDDDRDFLDAYRELRGLKDLDQIRRQMVDRAFHATNPSDRLLALLARMHLPEAAVLNHSKVEMTGAGGGPLAISHTFDPSKLSDEELAEVKAILQKAKPD